MVESNLQKRVLAVVSYFVLGLFALLCLLPFVMVISASLTDESALIKYGYGIIPKVFTLEAYRQIGMHPQTLINAYKVTIIVTVCRLIFPYYA